VGVALIGGVWIWVLAFSSRLGPDLSGNGPAPPWAHVR
jgi:hypothetical protein